MPDISFYILPSNSDQGRFKFACKLAEKVYRTTNKVYILTDTETQNQKIDDLLWSFRAGSFVPHHVYTESTPATENRVLIGSSNAPENWQQTIINLSSRCPENLEQSERILEILDSDETVKQSGRQRYRQYQQSGFNIKTHQM
jgi:DNA polymerase-3 subunit chi